MNTMSLKSTIGHPDHISRWSQVKQHLAEWQRRARSRHELVNLSDSLLHDIGLSRCDAMSEASKPFWMG